MFMLVCLFTLTFLTTPNVLRSVSEISKIISLYSKMYIDPDSITEEQVSYRPKSPLEWAHQALIQANSKPTKAIAQMELLRGVELRRGRNHINLFQPPNCEAALAYSRGQACRDCKRGRGPFAKCVILKGYVQRLAESASAFLHVRVLSAHGLPPRLVSILSGPH